MEIAKQIGGFSPAEADDLRKAIGKKIHSLMASLKDKFITGCIANNDLGVGGAPALGRHREVAGLLVQQGARGLLRADRLPHRLAAREPSVRVHGGADLLGDEHEGPRPGLRQRLRRARDRGAAARRQLLADRLRGRRGEDPLRAERGQVGRRVGGARDHPRARGGGAVRVDLGLHRARRPAGGQQAIARGAGEVRRARLDRRLADGDARLPRAGARLGAEARGRPAGGARLDLRRDRLRRRRDRYGPAPTHDSQRASSRSRSC